MAGKQEEDGSAQGNERGLKKTGPETGRKMRSLQEMSLEVIERHFEAIMETLGFNVREMKHLPSLKLLHGLASMATRSESLSPEIFESFAAELLGACKELQTLDDEVE